MNKHQAQADFHHAEKMRLHEMAVKLVSDGKDPFSAQRQAMIHSILEERHRNEPIIDDIAGIRVMVSKQRADDQTCQANSGRVYTFDEAMEQMPIPCHRGDLCMCYWEIVFEDEL